MSNELDRIKREIAELRTDYTSRLDALSDRLIKLEQDPAQVSNSVNFSENQDSLEGLDITLGLPEDAVSKKSPLHSPLHSTVQRDPWTGQRTAIANQEKRSAQKLNQGTDAAELESTTGDNSWIGERATKATQKQSPAKKIGQDVVVAGFFASVNKLLGPFSNLIHPLIVLYQRYKKEEKLAVFFLTFSGILALVVGFAFVLQYSFSTFLNEAAKIGLGLAVSVGVIALGAKISLKKSNMQDYGASLIGLGILLVYLCLYFMTTYYSLVGPTIGVALLAATTFAGCFLALRFETKIVAGISFIGGAFTPLILGGEHSGSMLYSAYLLLLSGTALYLSHKIRWTSLALISFVVTVGILEYVIFGTANVSNDNVLLIGLIHGFFYLYIYFSIFSGKMLLDTLDKKQVSIVAGSLVFFLGNIYGLSNTQFSLGMIYLVNALPFIALVFPLKIAVSPNQRATVLLIAGSLIGFAIPALFDISVAGLFWALEGILLLHLGFVFKSSIVRREGYLLVIISLAEMIWMTLPLEPQWQKGLLDLSYLNLISVGLVLWGISFTIKRHKGLCDAFDLQINNISMEVFSVWIAITFIISSYFLIAPYHLLISVIPLFYLLHRGYKQGLKYTQYLGFAHYGLILLQVYLSVQSVNSFHFSDQTLIGRIAIVESFALLAIIQLFYEKLAPDSEWLSYAKKLRITFLFLLPIVALPTAFHRFNELFPIILWASFIVSYIIATWRPHPLLRLESLSLYGMAAICSILYPFVNLPSSLFNTVTIGLYVGPLIGYLLVYREKGFSRQGYSDTWCWPVITSWYIHVGLVVAAVIYVAVGQFDIPLFVLGLYFVVLSIKIQIIPALRQWLRPLYWTGYALLASVVIIHSASQSYGEAGLITIVLNILALSIMFMAAKDRGIQHKLILGITHEVRRNRQTIEQWLTHGFAMLAYANALYITTGELLGPALTIALVIHATVILFMSLNEYYKTTLHLATILFGITLLKIFANDLEGFSLIQKILAFMVIGVILLGAAYKFQRFRVAQDQKEQTQ
ncbi:MAG: DUF2339 domain-containing protein [Ectothiorhodospiraceae bacterium]|nr:DUF2339 domain-containing protein [Ectothiorhodospiraceae bacterium]